MKTNREEGASVSSPRFRIILLQTSEGARVRMSLALRKPGAPVSGTDFVWCKTVPEAMAALEPGHTQWLISGAVNGSTRDASYWLTRAKQINPRLITGLFTSLRAGDVPNIDHYLPQGERHHDYADFLFESFRVWLQEAKTADSHHDGDQADGQDCAA